jgi:hypothetical protein
MKQFVDVPRGRVAGARCTNCGGLSAYDTIDACVPFNTAKRGIKLDNFQAS